NRPVPRGGEVMNLSKLYDGPRCPIIVAGRAKQTDYGDRLGVELFYWSKGVISYVPRDPPDTRYRSPDDRGWYEADVTHPGLTPSERLWCYDLRDVAQDTVTRGGKPCFVPAWIQDRKS